MSGVRRGPKGGNWRDSAVGPFGRVGHGHDPSISASSSILVTPPFNALTTDDRGQPNVLGSGHVADDFASQSKVSLCRGGST